MGGVVISPNMKRTKEMIDPQGNIIDPETKGIIELNDPGYVPTKEEIEAQINAVPIKENPTKSQDTIHETFPYMEKSITEQIDQAKKLLADLEVKKKEEIQRMKDELAKLEAE